MGFQSGRRFRFSRSAYAWAGSAYHRNRCFHCQQCAEKYLKAFLVENEIDFLRRHELIPLLDLYANVDKDFMVLLKDLRRLDSFAVSSRYPGVQIKSETAEEALIATERVRNFTRKKLKIK